MDDINEKLVTWANNNGFWSQSMLSACFQFGEITNENLCEIINAYKTKTFPEIKLQSNNITIGGKTYLKSIRGITNVNKLLNNQELKFNNNLTVIYGKNGTGKTGYVRIIKSMGNSLDNENIIYSDLTQIEQQEHTATIRFDNGSNEVEFIWNDNEKKDLNIKVFNSNCVRFSLNSKKEIQFIPQDFNFFNLINSSTSELAKLCKDRIENLKSEMLIYGIIDDTEVHKIIDVGFKKGEIKKEIDKYINDKKFNLENITNTISELERKSKELNLETLKLQINNTIKQKNKLENLINYIFIDSELYKNSFWEEYKKNLINLNTLLNTNIKIEDFVSNLNLNDNQKSLLKNFLLAAEEYLKSRGLKSFEDNSVCLFCGQKLDEVSLNLVSSYTKFITHDNTNQIKEMNIKISSIRKTLADSIGKIKQLLPFIEENIEIKESVNDILERLHNLYSINYENPINIKDFESNANLDSCKTKLDVILKSYTDHLKKLEDELSNIDIAISQNRMQLNELYSIKRLLENKDSIISNLEEQLNLLPLSKITNSSLSAIQSKILNNNYREKFNRVLSNQLELLDAPKNIKFAPNIVSSKLALKQSYLDKPYNLGNILSEGEQKVIALSHFIAENSMEEKDNILVFDDPVNSLDLQRMEIVARVLVMLSIKKQIIIFTHNLVFVGFLSAYSKEILQQDEQTFVCINTIYDNGKEYTGQIKYEFPNIETYKNYKELINKKMNNAAAGSLGKDEMYDCFEYMRSALELLVVEKVLKGTVNRYEPDIKMGRFETIETEKLNENSSRITALFNQLCRYIKGHSSSAQARMEPDFDSLQKCYTEFKELDKIFK